MSLAIQELERRVRTEPGAADAFLAEHDFPLVEGRSITFVFRGHAEAVNLRHWIHGLGSSQPFRPVPGSDVWTLTLDLPERSRMEYKLEVIQGHRRQLIRDPLNPNLATDPFGANSVVFSAGYESPDWVMENQDSRPGEVRDYEIPTTVFGGTRPLQVYLPARFHPRRRYPLVIAHDGPEYLRYSNFKIVLDNLIHRLHIPAMIVALTESPNRMEEYVGGPPHGEFIVHDLLPFLEHEFPLVDQPSARALMGASLGGVASLATAWRHPGIFGNLLLQSSSFAFTDIGEHDGGPVFDQVVEFMNAFRENPGKPTERIYMSCGTYEGMINYNRSMVPLLQSTGMEVRFSEARDGHNWENWRDRLQEGLSWLFPGPLWMVYE